MTDMIDVAEVDSRLATAAKVAPARRVPLSKAAGRTLREDIRADRPLPPFNRVMMDGYALRYQAGTLPTMLRVADTAFAGERVKSLPEQVGAAIEVATGAILPEGADTVVPYEDTERVGESEIRLLDPEGVEIGQCIHREGSDFARHSLLVPPGSLLSPAALGVAASCGYASVLVTPRPRIVIATTGDELVSVDATPAPHQIRASNGTALEAALGLAGFNVGEVVHWPDDAVAGRAALESILEGLDALIVIGAISKGARDWLPAALDSVGEKIFHNVRQKPGKPMGFWKTADDRVIFALPGNPVSALIGVYRYVLPFFRRRDGQPPKAAIQVELAEGVSFPAPLTWFLPVQLDADGRAVPRPVNNSGDYARLVDTDGFVELPADASSWTSGFPASFYPWF